MKSKKIIRLMLVLSTLLLPSLSNNSNYVTWNTPRRALAKGDVSEVFSGSIGEFKDRVYNKIQGTTQIGKYYSVGVMGHHQVVNYGYGMALKTRELEKISEFYGAGTLDSLTISNKVIHTVSRQTATTAEVKLGVVKMINASVNFLETGKVGAETNVAAHYKFEQTDLYSESFSRTESVSASYDLDNLLLGKKRFCISRIALYIEVPITSSYTEEQSWGKWYKIDNTVKTNYYAHYYIDDVITFRYEDNTFGDKVMGEYYIDNTIKNY